MKQTKGIGIEVALRNIESSMRFEGFDFSEETRAACREILESGERAGEVAEEYMKKSSLGKTEVPRITD